MLRPQSLAEVYHLMPIQVPRSTRYVSVIDSLHEDSHFLGYRSPLGLALPQVIVNVQAVIHILQPLQTLRISPRQQEHSRRES